MASEEWLTDHYLGRQSISYNDENTFQETIFIPGTSLNKNSSLWMQSCSLSQIYSLLSVPTATILGYTADVIALEALALTSFPFFLIHAPPNLLQSPLQTKSTFLKLWWNMLVSRYGIVVVWGGMRWYDGTWCGMEEHEPRFRRQSLRKSWLCLSVYAPSICFCFWKMSPSINLLKNPLFLQHCNVYPRRHWLSSLQLGFKKWQKLFSFQEDQCEILIKLFLIMWKVKSAILGNSCAYQSVWCSYCNRNM